MPTILLRGECDYVDWGVVEQYWDALPNLDAYAVSGAGSMLHLSQPELVKELILAFLNESASPLEPLTEDEVHSFLR